MTARVLVFLSLSTLTLAAQSVLQPEEPTGLWIQQSRAEVLKKRFKNKTKTPLKKSPLPSGNIPRIVGGKEAQRNAYPWIAAIVDPSEPDLFLSQFCGGTLVHPHWVVTAAHCVIGLPSDGIEVVLGAHDLSNSAGIQRIKVNEIILHPKYLEDTVTINFDIALLRLETPAEARFTTLPLIDADSLQQAGTLARTIGWGNTSSIEGLESYPDILQEADVPISSFATANSTVAYSQNLTDQMLAAGFPQGGIDSCQGDSGGPLMVPSPHPTGWSLAGVVSFGTGCALPNTPGIYTKVSAFRDFLLDHIAPNYLQWEQTQSSIGELRDPDNDGFNNFSEFAFQTNINSPDSPSADYAPQMVEGSPMQGLTFRSAKERSGIKYTVLQSPNLDFTAGQAYPIESLPSSDQEVTGNAFASDLTVTLPLSTEPTQSFLRVEAEMDQAITTGTRTLTVNSGATGDLVAEDLASPLSDNRRQKLYRLTGLTADEPITISGRSSEFDVVLELLDRNDLSVIASSAANNAEGSNGTDEFLTFTPTEGTSYTLRLTSQSDNETGFFELGCFDQEFQSLPEIELGRSINGGLSISDSLDLDRSPNPYRQDLYYFENTDSSRFITVSITSSVFDTRLNVISLESGRSVAFNDDSSGTTTDSSTIFPTVPGVNYLIQVSSFAAGATGSYRLSVSN